jgi:two-component system, OmpR family, KDP operon response regulator KdpE
MTTSEPVVLLVEDEPQMRRFLRTTLGSRGYRLLEAPTMAEASTVMMSRNPNLILLDLGLPDGDGLDLCRRLREFSRVPVIVISARGREADKVQALDAGADDYLTKPFGAAELLARMRVALRHAEQSAHPDMLSTMEVGDVMLDPVRRLVTRSGEEIHLTPTEYRLFLLLAQNAGTVLTHSRIIREIWGQSGETTVHHLRVHMAELRRKIEREPSRPTVIVTEPGVGYRLREPRNAA